MIHSFSLINTYFVSAFFVCICMCTLLCLHTDIVRAQPGGDNKTIIVYYSRTGKSEAVAQTLNRNLDADILRIKDMKDRSGTMGFILAAFDAFLDKTTTINPSSPDFTRYSRIILVSPIWNWTISVPIKTLIKRSDFGGKKLIMVTTANIHIKKYDHYGDDAPFIKRFFRDYLRDKSRTMRAIAQETGADIRAHFHIATKDVPESQIKEKASCFIPDIQEAFSR